MAHNVQIETGPGPIDPSVLYEQYRHVSEKIWTDNLNFAIQSRNGTHCPEHLDDRVLNWFYIAGFYGLYQLYHIRVDWGLIGALVERWRPETHTFHFPPGECTVTLQDVEVLGGLRVDGNPIIRNDKGETIDDRLDCVERLLGRRPPEADVDSLGLKLTWIKNQFPSLADNATELEVLQYSRAMMILLLGGTFFSDKSGAYAPFQFFPFLEDLPSCGQLSWGSALLSHLYNNLCRAAKSDRRIPAINVVVAGPLILLQIWAWTRFTNICPIPYLPPAPNNGRPYTYGYRWANAARQYTSLTVGHNHDWFRDQFDDLKDNQIIWTPYAEVMDTLPDICKAGESIWRTRSPLIYFSCVEYHFVERVFRQFGRRQAIPQEVVRYDRFHWRTRQGNANTNWEVKNNEFVKKWNDRLLYIVDEQYGVSVADGYMDWYKRITRLRIGSTRSTAPARGIMPVAGLHDRTAYALNYCYDAFRNDPTNPIHAERLRTQFFPGVGLPIPNQDNPAHASPQDYYVPSPPPTSSPQFQNQDLGQPSYQDFGQSSYPTQPFYQDPGQSSYQNQGQQSNAEEDIDQSTFNYFFR